MCGVTLSLCRFTYISLRFDLILLICADKANGEQWSSVHVCGFV